MDEKSRIFQELDGEIDWLTINAEMRYLWGKFFIIASAMDGDIKKKLGGSLKSLEKARKNIEARGEQLSPRQRANFTLLRIKYGKYVEEDGA